MRIIKTARRFAGGIPLGWMPLVSLVYAKVFHGAYKEPEVTARFRGLSLITPTHDVTIVPGLLGGFYERVEIDVFERLAALSPTVVDVGANIGIYACLAARAQPAGGIVVAYEPIPENVGYLRRNIGANAPGQAVLLREAAVGAASGDLALHLANGIGQHSAAPTDTRHARGIVQVPLVTLDDDLPRIGAARPDLVKIDVEGYDGFVLSGARRILSEAHPTLFVEFVPQHLRRCGFDPAEFLDIVFSYGSEVFLAGGTRSGLRRVQRADLGSANERIAANLIVPGRPQHLDLVERYRSGAADGVVATP